MQAQVIPKYETQDLLVVLGSETKPIARATLYRIIKRDPTFPKPVNCNPNRWIAEHVHRWIESHSKLSA